MFLIPAHWEDPAIICSCGIAIALYVAAHSSRWMPSVQTKTDSEIRAAVKNCLARCMQGDTPLGIIAEFKAELRDSGWSESDVLKVEQTVRKMLAGIVDSDTDQP